jgi:hypothetical protein
MKQNAAFVSRVLMTGIEFEDMLKAQQRVIIPLQFQQNVSELFP